MTREESNAIMEVLTKDIKTLTPQEIFTLNGLAIGISWMCKVADFPRTGC